MFLSARIIEDVAFRAFCNAGQIADLRAAFAAEAGEAGIGDAAAHDCLREGDGIWLAAMKARFDGSLWIDLKLRIMVELKAMAADRRAPYDLKDTDEGFEAFVGMLFAKEAEFREESDRAVRQFIDTGKWPEQSAWSVFITFMRFNCALDFICQLQNVASCGVHFSDPEKKCAEDVLSALFLEHWYRCFDFWLKLTAVSEFFRLPFYGMTWIDD